MTLSPSTYVGRFAPSPTGRLHWGSLITALGSYLDAKFHQGQWLLRIENIDRPRELRGASDQIKADLVRFGLCWDGEILFQHQRHDAYQDALKLLIDSGLVYGCGCTRKTATHAIYSGHCRQAKLPLNTNTLRVKTDDAPLIWTDSLRGCFHEHLSEQCGDFVIRRRDGIWSYQWAVVIDDAFQHVSHVVRGGDLLASTARQIWLQDRLNLPRVKYMHLPLVTDPDGIKLSKSHFAPALSEPDVSCLLYDAMVMLNHRPPAFLIKAPVHELLTWGILNWQPARLPHQNLIANHLVEQHKND